MGGGGGGKGGGEAETQSSSSSAPWGPQQPYLKEIFSKAQELYNSGQLAPEYYSGKTVADQSSYTKNAMKMAADRAMNGSDIINQATAGITDVVNGNALANNTGLNLLNQYAQGTNPYIDALYQDAAGQAAAQINGAFSKAGRYGSGAQAAALSDSMTDLANQMYSNAYNQAVSAAGNAANAYNTGVGTQVSSAQAAQNLGNQAYTDAEALSQVGAVADDYAQSLIDAKIEKYNYNAQRPMMALQNYLNLVSGQYGGETNATTETSSGGGK